MIGFFAKNLSKFKYAVKLILRILISERLYVFFFFIANSTDLLHEKKVIYSNDARFLARLPRRSLPNS